MTNNATIINFRTPEELKRQFHWLCLRRNLTMTCILNQLVHDYVEQELVQITEMDKRLQYIQPVRPQTPEAPPMPFFS